MRKTFVYLIFFILLISICNFSYFFVENVEASGSTLHVGSGQAYSTIQDAINAANNGDTVYVHSGTYNENIGINKQITLQGESKETTIIDGSSANNHTLTIKSNNITIKDLEIKNTDGSSYSCIIMDSASNCEINNNIIKESGNGLYLLSNSDNNLIKENTIEYNNIGIYFSNGDNNVVRDNIIRNNNAYGIQLSQYSTGNTIYLNDFDDNNNANVRDLSSNIWSYNSQGNYWDDYDDYDNDEDGIGDNPYVIDANSQDDYPLGDFLNQQEENNPPIATIDNPTGSTSVSEGEEISFQGHGADSDSGDSIQGYYWRSNKDGFISSKSSFTTSSLSVNQHTIYFKVKDNHNLWSNENSVEVTVSQNNQKPTATITSIQPNSSNFGETIQFNGFGTVTTGSKITDYQWRSNISGVLSNLSSFTYNNLSAGKHMIYFKVKDDQGLWSDEVNEKIQVNQLINHKPVALLNGPYKGFQEEKIVFDASNSYDEDTDTLTYFWDFGDGNNSTKKIAEHSYIMTGNYSISLTVTDSKGNSSTVKTYADITFSSDDNNSQNDTNKSKEKEDKGISIPGFEILFLLISTLLIVYFRKRH